MKALLLALSLLASLTAEDLPLIGLAHAGFRVSDLEKARAFYHGVLGFDEAFDLKAPDGHIALAYFKVNDNQFIEIFPGVPPGTTVMMTHIAFYTADIEALHKAMEARGLPVVKINDGKDGNRNFGIRKPPGQSLDFIEFVQYMPNGWHLQSAGKKLGERRISTHLQHAGIVVTDFEAARRFWEEQMAFPVRWTYKKDGERISLMHFRLPAADEWVETGNPLKPITDKRQLGVVAHISLEVPDIKAAYQQAMERGVTDLKQPLLGADGQWQLNLYDPDGTRIELMQPKAAGSGSVCLGGTGIQPVEATPCVARGSQSTYYAKAK